MLHCRQPWDEFFDNIDSVMTKIDEEKVGEAKKAKRIVYFIDDGWNQVAVCEQSWLKSGRWGMARDVKLKRFLECSLPSMDDFDRRLAMQARWQTPSYCINIPIEAALPMLADCNRLFTGPLNDLVPVKVTHEKPCLIVQKLGDGIKIVPNYMLSGTVLQSDATDAIYVYQSPTHYVIYDLEPKLKKIYDSFAAYDDLIPASEEKRIHRLLDKVKDVVDVFSSDFDEGHSLETVDGDARLVLQARPTETGFTLRLCVRPLTAGRLTFAPGKGEATVVDEVEGRHLQVKRDLKAELANLEVFETFADSQEGIALRGDKAVLDIESMLELLAFAPGETKSLVIEWPEGEKLRLREPKKGGAWGVGLRHHGGWFEPEGTVELSDESLVAFADLIRSLAGSRGRFVRLAEGDYIRLDKNIRRKLDAIDAVTVESRGSIQMSTFGAALLPDELFEGDLSFRGDSRLEALRARVSSAESEEAPVPETLKASLRDYQLEGYRWIARLNSWGAGACLADDMGLGKTVQAIAYLLHTAAEGASLVVAPASVIHNWRNELARFAPSLKVVVLNECADRDASLKGAEAGCVVVATYGLLVSESKALTAKEWNTVVLDEAHTIKNRDTKMSTSAMKLKATHRLILTGTPVQNRLGELWNLFRFINPGLLGSYDQFKAKFITPIEELQDKERQAQLNRLVHPFMLRRTKREVVAELPDKEEITLRVELSEGEEAVCELIRLHAEEMLHAEESDRVGVATLAEITRLRQAACSASLIEKSYSGPCSKITALLDLLAELQEGEHRALIFSQFTSFLAQVRKALDDSGIPYLYLDGSVPPKQRAQLVKEFQEGSCPFFLISLKAGGLGLNLTAANYVVHLDPWWNPAIEQQATDRAYRIGQTQKVTAYHLVAAGTIEEKILRLHETKRNLADALLDGTDLSSRLTAKELMELLEKDAREI
jgi:superfamily II DNA or RNA helicase